MIELKKNHQYFFSEVNLSFWHISYFSRLIKMLIYQNWKIPTKMVMKFVVMLPKHDWRNEILLKYYYEILLLLLYYNNNITILLLMFNISNLCHLSITSSVIGQPKQDWSPLLQLSSFYQNFRTTKINKKPMLIWASLPYDNSYMYIGTKLFISAFFFIYKIKYTYM